MTSRSSPVLVLSALALLAGTGCASSPKLQNMIPSRDGVALASSGRSLVVADMGGGQESNLWDGSRINARGFRLALVESLRRSGLFAEVSLDPPADMRLSGTLLTQDQPGIAFGVTVRMSVRYVLTDGATGEELFNDIVASTYTAGMGESLVGMVRLRKANEGAVRENIRALTSRLAAVSFE